MSLVKVLLLAPVLEELIFRGGIQTLLDRTAPGGRLVVPGVTAGNVLTRAVRGCASVGGCARTGRGDLLPSLVFGRLRQLSPSLLPAMIVHALYNACYLVAGMAWATRLSSEPRSHRHATGECMTVVARN